MSGIKTRGELWEGNVAVGGELSSLESWHVDETTCMK